MIRWDRLSWHGLAAALACAAVGGVFAWAGWSVAAAAAAATGAFAGGVAAGAQGRRRRGRTVTVRRAPGHEEAKAVPVAGRPGEGEGRPAGRATHPVPGALSGDEEATSVPATAPRPGVAPTDPQAAGEQADEPGSRAEAPSPAQPDAEDKSLAAVHWPEQVLTHLGHGVRTPLNGILGLTDLAFDTPLTGQQREYLDEIRGSAHSLEKLLADFLELARSQTSGLELDERPFSLRECVAHALSAAGGLAERKGLELISYIRPDVPDAVRGDADRLRQVVWQIVVNAVQFTPRGEVVVHVEHEGKTERQVQVHVRVSDTGLGIAPAGQERVFRPFEHAEGEGTCRHDSPGLGLAVCEDLVTRMGGRIWVDSQVDLGSTFHVALTLARQACDTRPADHADPATLRELRHLPVLLVVGHRTTRRVLAEMLRQWGMRVELADSGAHALTRLRRSVRRGRRFPLVILDAALEDTDALALAERIQQESDLAGAPLLLLPPGRPRDLVDRCKALGPVAWVAKPVAEADMLHAISVTLDPPWDAPAAAVERAAPPEVRPLRILLAEDNEINRKVLCRLLANHGHTVTAVADGQEAVDAWQAGAFDLVLMDVQMPHTDGVAAAQAIREREAGGPRHVPIVALTAHTSPVVRRRCQAAGMDAFLTKPVEARLLLEEVTRITRESPVRTAAGSTGGERDSREDQPADADGHQVLNVPAALCQLDGRPSLLRMIAEVFLETWPTVQGDLQRAMRACDAEKLVEHTAALTGSLGNFAAREACDAAEELQRYAGEGDLRQAQEALAMVNLQVWRLARDLRAYLAEDATSSPS